MSAGCRYITSESFVEELRQAGGDLSAIICGAPTQDGSSYCAEHHRVCWRAPPARGSTGNTEFAGSFAEARRQQRHHQAAAE